MGVIIRVWALSLINNFRISIMNKFVLICVLIFIHTQCAMALSGPNSKQFALVGSWAGIEDYIYLSGGFKYGYSENLAIESKCEFDRYSTEGFSIESFAPSIGLLVRTSPILNVTFMGSGQYGAIFTTYTIDGDSFELSGSDSRFSFGAHYQLFPLIAVQCAREKRNVSVSEVNSNQMSSPFSITDWSSTLSVIVSPHENIDFVISKVYDEIGTAYLLTKFSLIYYLDKPLFSTEPNQFKRKTRLNLSDLVY